MSYRRRNRERAASRRHPSHRRRPSRLLSDHSRPLRRRPPMRVFLAGATGAIGPRLVPQLVAAGHSVVATTRTRSKLDLLAGLGAEPVVVDGLDAAAVGE